LFQSKISALLLLVSIIAISGCAQQKKVETIPPTEAHEKLKRVFKEEFNLDAVTKAYNNTLWVYLPLNEPYLKYTSSGLGPVKSPEAQSKLIIKYLDGKVQDNSFNITYDIGTDNKYKNDRGIGSRFTEEFSVRQQHILTAINLAYGDSEKSPDGNEHVESIPGDRNFLGYKENAAHKRLVHDYVSTDKVPDFFVVIIADIETGIETKMTIYLQDLLRAFYDQGFGEEYVRRLIVDQPIGYDKIIGDKSGEHIESYDISWQEFLIKQMVHRINFKYQQSAFPPSDDTQSELLSIAADTITAYDFKDFDMLILNDLNTKTTQSIPANELANYKSEQSEGRLIHIKFQP